MLKLIVVAVSVGMVVAHHDESLHTATCFLSGKAQGTVKFTELEDRQVRVEAHISGMPAGQYGFHVHEKGDLSGGCATAGAHFNPERVSHGSPSDAVRHVGDLGNIQFNESGVAEADFVDRKLALRGPSNILGRAVVLHEGTDDFGKSEHPDSKTTGNAGGRAACCVIGLL